VSSLERLNLTLELLDDLEQTLLEGWMVPLSGRVAVDRLVCQSIMEEVRAGLPRAFQAARELEAEREAILQGADVQAGEMIEMAQRQADFLVAESPLTKAAEIRAEEMARRAQDQAYRIKDEAVERTRGVYLRTERHLQGLLAEVQEMSSRADESWE